MRRCGVVAIPLLLLMSSCSDNTIDNDVETDTSEVDEQALRTELNVIYPPTEIPEGVPEIPHSGVCVSEQCITDRVTFENRDWPNAWRGDYQAQRNVAYCLAGSCSEAVWPDLTSSCAWRSVILETHPDKATDLDGQALENVCGKLSQGQALTAVKKAESIYEHLQRIAREGATSSEI